MTLDPRQLGAEGGGERAGEHRLAHTGHILDEEMAARERGHDGSHERPFAAEQDLLEVADQRLAQSDGVVQRRARARRTTLMGYTASPWAIDADTTGVPVAATLRRSPHA